MIFLEQAGEPKRKEKPVLLSLSALSEVVEVCFSHGGETMRDHCYQMLSQVPYGREKVLHGDEYG